MARSAGVGQSRVSSGVGRATARAERRAATSRTSRATTSRPQPGHRGDRWDEPRCLMTSRRRRTGWPAVAGVQCFKAPWPGVVGPCLGRRVQTRSDSGGVALPYPVFANYRLRGPAHGGARGGHSVGSPFSGWCRHDLVAGSRCGRQHSAVRQHMRSRRRDQGCASGQERHRIHHHRLLAVAPWV
jgi:hypothetical protein